MNSNVFMSKDVGVVGFIGAKSHGAGTYTTDWIAAKDFARFLALVGIDDTGLTAGTVNAKLEQAKDASGTGAKDITGKAITQIGASSPTEDKIALIDLKPDELDLANEFDYFRLSVTIGSAAVQVAGLVLGDSPRYGDAGDVDMSAVVEIVN